MNDPSVPLPSRGEFISILLVFREHDNGQAFFCDVEGVGWTRTGLAPVPTEIAIAQLKSDKLWPATSHTNKLQQKTLSVQWNRKI